MGVETTTANIDLSILKNKNVQLSAVLSAGNFFYSFLDNDGKHLIMREEVKFGDKALNELASSLNSVGDKYGFNIIKTKKVLNMTFLPLEALEAKRTKKTTAKKEIRNLPIENSDGKTCLTTPSSLIAKGIDLYAAKIPRTCAKKNKNSSEKREVWLPERRYH